MFPYAASWGQQRQSNIAGTEVANTHIGLMVVAFVLALSVLVIALLLIRLGQEIRWRMRTEQSLRFQIGLQAAVMEAVPTPLFLQDENGRYLAVNPALEEATGLLAEQLIGKPTDGAGLFDVDEWSKIESSLTQVRATSARVKGSTFYTTLDGERREALYWVRACTGGADHPDTVLAAFLDVADLRKMQRREVELKQQLVELTQSVPIGIFQLRYLPKVGFSLSFVNAPAFRMLGVSSDVAEHLLLAFGQALSEPARYRLIRSLLRGSCHDQATDMEIELSRLSNEEEVVRIVAVPSDGKAEGMLWNGYVQDITQARRQSLALSDAKCNAEAASAAKDALLATVSHELRTPLSGVKGILELLEHAELGEEEQRLVGIGRSAASILSAILEDILAFSAATQGELKVVPRNVSIVAVAREAAALIEPSAEKKGLSLEVDVAPGLACSYVADDRRLAQVLLNLLGNSVKFTESGRVVLRVSSRSVDLSRDLVTLEVSDTGMGIAPDEVAMIFEPFVRGHGANRDKPGVGLGLSISRAIVESMGGRISVSRFEEHGTTMSVELTLPIARSVVVDSLASEPPELAKPPPDGNWLRGKQRMHVLVVDDAQLNRDLLQLQLARLAMTCDVASDGAQALRLLRSKRYDLIITDYAMPGMDGPELIARIRGELGHAAVPIYVLTAHLSTTLRAACLEAGANEVLLKPLDLVTLQSKLGTEQVADDAVLNARSALSLEENPALRTRLIAALDELLAELRLPGTLKARDAAKLREIAHRTAGTAAWFGLNELATTARETEDWLDGGNFDDDSARSLIRAIDLVVKRLSNPL
ncbi:hybrid sensor histidine kinase/response regulator [Pandoraea anapnoica]|uniref:histidine kinase n=1 Tax=Pandoraea anapnoica TaxID=2508301 RepID=A0A5E5AHU6_9BURK|nr:MULTISPECIES: ATP-binding protein [Pandoraea]VVE42815.1 hybrid sensor histidine kinase/response regulator [Pandoraea iniqua]VVE73219.1 hybrid sensor histidine kinase/response regulator [Pandoraea anapnoica]